jgi:hypothetical protein
MNFDKPDRPEHYNELIREGRDAIQSMRIWSVFLEEDSGNISMFGVARLKIGLSGFRVFSDRCTNTNAQFFRRDNEGELYSCSESELGKLLNGDEVRVHSIFGQRERLVNPRNLHPTSAYRAYHYLAAKNPNRLKPKREEARP